MKGARVVWEVIRAGADGIPGFPVLGDEERVEGIVVDEEQLHELLADKRAEFAVDTHICISNPIISQPSI